MKRYDGLRKLFWLLATSLSIDALGATEFNFNTNPSEALTIGVDTYNLLDSFETDNNLAGIAIGTTGATVIFDPLSNAITVEIDGTGTPTVSDNFELFDDTGALLLQLNPSGTFNVTGTYTTTNYASADSNNILESVNGTVNFQSASSLTNFRGTFRHTAGTLDVQSDNTVMANGGTIDIDGGTTTF